MALGKGIWSALLAAALFGAGTPIAKQLLGEVSPVMLAGLFYAGSGLGLAIAIRRDIRNGLLSAAAARAAYGVAVG